jgi:hypothetical protein
MHETGGLRSFLHDDLDTVCLDSHLITAPAAGKLWPQVIERSPLPSDVRETLLSSGHRVQMVVRRANCLNSGWSATAENAAAGRYAHAIFTKLRMTEWNEQEDRILASNRRSGR